IELVIHAVHTNRRRRLEARISKTDRATSTDTRQWQKLSIGKSSPVSDVVSDHRLRECYEPCIAIGFLLTFGTGHHFVHDLLCRLGFDQRFRSPVPKDL